MDASTFAVGRVTLRGGAKGASAGALRLRAASGLQAADLTPPGLPPAAVLVVRRLADPMPRRFRARHLRPRPEWERAVREALAGQARAAARPDAYGRIDPSATAVLFDDEAQAIACLIVDRAYGRVAAGWWWASLIPRLRLPAAAVAGGSRDPAAILVARAREAPAVLATVVRWGEARAIARALTREGAIAVLQSMAREHGVDTTDLLDPRDTIVHRSDAGRGHTPFAARRRPPTAWARWVPADLAGTGEIAEVQRLFAVALSVHESPRMQTAPAASRVQAPPPEFDRIAPDPSPGNAASVANAGDRRDGRLSTPFVQESARPESVAPRQKMPANVAATAVAARALQSDAPTTQALENDATPRDEVRSVAPPNDNTPRMTVDPIAPASDPAAAGAVPPEREEVPLARVSKPRSHIVAKDNPVEARADDVRRLAGVLATEGTPTQLGGVFYLIHALDCLQLPGAFERGWRLESTAGPWGTLDLIARALLGNAWRPRDPVWDALAHLAGPHASGSARTVRPYRSRVQDGAADPAFLAPADWTGELGESLDRVMWSTTSSRIWVWSPDGYVLTHRRAHADPSASVRRAVRRFRHQGKSTALVHTRSTIPWMPLAALPVGCPARLGRWAAAAAPAVRRRLRLAVSDAGKRPADLLRFPARLYVTSSHVDVVFALCDIDVRVRRAGLDRDPGWKPAYGRVVSFHFE